MSAPAAPAAALFAFLNVQCVCVCVCVCLQLQVLQARAECRAPTAASASPPDSGHGDDVESLGGGERERALPPPPPPLPPASAPRQVHKKDLRKLFGDEGSWTTNLSLLPPAASAGSGSVQIGAGASGVGEGPHNSSWTSAMFPSSLPTPVPVGPAPPPVSSLRASSQGNLIYASAGAWVLAVDRRCRQIAHVTHMSAAPNASAGSRVVDVRLQMWGGESRVIVATEAGDVRVLDPRMGVLPLSVVRPLADWSGSIDVFAAHSSAPLIACGSRAGLKIVDLRGNSVFLLSSSERGRKSLGSGHLQSLDFHPTNLSLVASVFDGYQARAVLAGALV